jgi:uncharacterized glyoxalase superfamily protein PhnB
VVVNRSAPTATVVPILVYEDVGKAIDWLCDTFGFKERLRAGAPNGSVSHAQLDIGDGSIILGRQGAEFRPPRRNEVNQYVTVHVESVDKHFEHAQQCGANEWSRRAADPDRARLIRSAMRTHCRSEVAGKRKS